MLASAVRNAVNVLALTIARGAPVGESRVSVPDGDVVLSFGVACGTNVSGVITS